MTEADQQLRRFRAKEAIRGDFEHSLEQRVDRYLEVQHRGIVPNHHFASASSECLNLYRDGYFLSTVMVSQSVAEGIFRFALERNALTADRERPEMVKLLVERAIISESCGNAFVRIWRSFRNDVHHMNPRVAQVPFKELAQRNIRDLATIENEIFEWRTSNGKLVPVRAKYWDLQPDGSIPVFLRLE
jgi:hypothetical protein